MPVIASMLVWDFKFEITLNQLSHALKLLKTWYFAAIDFYTPNLNIDNSHRSGLLRIVFVLVLFISLYTSPQHPQAKKPSKP